MAKSSTFALEIISPQGIIFNGDAESVTLPVKDERIMILPNHTPIFTKLYEGEIEIKKDNKYTTVVISGGFLEVKHNSVHILSDYAIRAESIEIAKAEARLKMAEQKIKQKLENEEFTIADKDLRLSILELKVAQKMRKRQRAE